MRTHPHFAPTADPRAAGVPTVQFEAQKIAGFTPATEQALDQAIVFLNDHFFSAGFRTQIVNASTFFRNGLTPQQVYDALMPPNDLARNRIVLRLSVYDTYAGGGEVGVTTHDDRGLYLTSTYQKYILENGAKCYAAHLAHEYCHWRGFLDLGLFARIKHRSVPYVVGDLFAEYLGADCP